MKNNETILLTSDNIPWVDPRTLALANKVGELVGGKIKDWLKKLWLLNINNAIEFDIYDSLENLINRYQILRKWLDENWCLAGKNHSPKPVNWWNYTWNNIIGEFSRWLLLSRNFSQNTVDNYIRTLTKFDNFIIRKSEWERGVNTPEKFTLYDVDWFVEELREEWLSARTCNNRISAIKTFLRFCWIRWQRAGIEAKDFFYAKEERRKIDALTEVDCRVLLNYMRCDKSKSMLQRVRDYCMVMIMLYTWLRVSELCNLRIDSIKESLLIKWKWRKYRNVYLFEKHLNMLWDYITLCRSKGINSDYVFISLSKNSIWKQLSRNSVERVVREAWENAWIHSPVFPHKLRHTFATQLLKKDVNLMSIKELMWHSSILTTQTYLTLESEELKNAQWNLQDFEINPNNLPDSEYQTIAWYIKNKPDLFNIWKYNPMNQLTANALSWF